MRRKSEKMTSQWLLIGYWKSISLEGYNKIFYRNYCTYRRLCKVQLKKIPVSCALFKVSNVQNFWILNLYCIYRKNHGIGTLRIVVNGASIFSYEYFHKFEAKIAKALAFVKGISTSPIYTKMEKSVSLPCPFPIKIHNVNDTFSL